MPKIMPKIERYAFRKDCCVSTLFGDDGKRQTLRFDGPCIYCRKPQSVRVDAEAAMKFSEGMFAQDAFPELSPGEREFLISGICDKCWDKMFGEPEDESEEEKTAQSSSQPAETAPALLLSAEEREAVLAGTMALRTIYYAEHDKTDVTFLNYIAALEWLLERTKRPPCPTKTTSTNKTDK